MTDPNPPAATPTLRASSSFRVLLRSSFAATAVAASLSLAGCAGASGLATHPHPSSTPTAEAEPSPCEQIEATPPPSSQFEIVGNVTFDEEPVEGAKISVDGPGDFFAEVCTGTDGRWSMPVPSREGWYTALLDESTLPEGVEASASSLVIQTEFGLTDKKAVNFLLGDTGRPEPAAGGYTGTPELWCEVIRIKYDPQIRVLESTGSDSDLAVSAQAAEELYNAVPELQAVAYDEFGEQVIAGYQQTYETWAASAGGYDALRPVTSAALNLQSLCPADWMPPSG